MKSLCSICALLSPLLIISCGSIVNGSKQSVGFSSSPDGATVSIDGMPRGRTPITIELERDEDHTVRITLPGYYPYSATLTHSVSGWVWGNLPGYGEIFLWEASLDWPLMRVQEAYMS